MTRSELEERVAELEGAIEDALEAVAGGDLRAAVAALREAIEEEDEPDD